MNVAFRFDAASAIGYGHASRCLVLARALKRASHRVLIILRAHPGHPGDAIRAEGFETICLSWRDHNAHPWLGCTPEEDATECAAILDDFKPDLVVVDHYALTQSWERKLAHEQRCIMVLEDAPDRKHHCDVLLDQGPAHQRTDYQTLVPERCELLLGSQFALLRPEFFRERLLGTTSRTRAASERSRCVVTLGGSDPDGLTLRVLSELTHVSGPERMLLTIVIDRTAPFAPAVHEWCASTKLQATVEYNVADMAVLYRDHEFAIGAGGVSALERAAVGLPSLLLCAAPNQLPNLHTLHALGAATFLDAPAKLARAVDKFLDEPELRALQRARGLGLCDGLGLLRVLKRLSVDVTPNLSPATIDDADTLFALQAEPENRRYFRDPTPPTWCEHIGWLRDQLSRRDRRIYLIHLDDFCVGSIRIDQRNQPSPAHSSAPRGTPAWEISIVVCSDARGLGIATRGLRALSSAHPGFTLIADIHPENTASIRAFLAAGFRHRTDREYILEPR